MVSNAGVRMALCVCVAPREGVEPPTYALGVHCSIQLS